MPAAHRFRFRSTKFPSHRVPHSRSPVVSLSSSYTTWPFANPRAGTALFRAFLLLLLSFLPTFCLVAPVAAQEYLGLTYLGEVPVGEGRSHSFRVPVSNLLYRDCTVNCRINRVYMQPISGPGSFELTGQSVRDGDVARRNSFLEFSVRFTPRAAGPSRSNLMIRCQCSVQAHPARTFFYGVYGDGRLVQNLTALKPERLADNRLSYGYRVGPQGWNPAGQYVEVELYYAASNGALVSRIDARTLRTDANAVERFTVDPGTPPEGATKIVCLIDRLGRVPETDEGDNKAETNLPNLSVSLPYYDDATGSLIYSYQVNGADATTIRQITVGVYFAKGPTVRDILPNVPPAHSSTIDLRAGSSQQFVLGPGEDLPLPPHEATHIVAVIDRDNLIRPEVSEVDNVRVNDVEAARGYTKVSSMPGVAIYKRAEFFATVVDLRHATLGQQYSRIVGGPLSWWDSLSEWETPSRVLFANLNGTFFEGEAFIGIYGFSYGLKADGQIVDRGIKGEGNPNSALFTYDNRHGSAAVLPNIAAAYDSPVYNQLIGGVAGRIVTFEKTTTRRQWAGIRDYMGQDGPLGERRYRIVVFLTTSEKISWSRTVNEMKYWGIPRPQIVQLDSGGSSSLVRRRRRVVVDSDMAKGKLTRPFPHAIGVYSGK